MVCRVRDSQEQDATRETYRRSKVSKTTQEIINAKVNEARQAEQPDQAEAYTLAKELEEKLGTRDPYICWRAILNLIVLWTEQGIENRWIIPPEDYLERLSEDLNVVFAEHKFRREGLALIPKGGNA
jgi:hypothetical protein